MMISLTNASGTTTNFIGDHDTEFLVFDNDRYLPCLLANLLDGDVVAEHVIGEGFIYYIIGLLP